MKTYKRAKGSLKTLYLRPFFEQILLQWQEFTNTKYDLLSAMLDFDT